MWAKAASGTFICLITLFNIVLLKAEPQWTYDLISISSSSNVDDFIDFNFDVKAIKRGFYAFSGYTDIKRDLTSSVRVDVQFFRSKSEKDDDFQATAFGMNDNFMGFMNQQYKRILMEPLKECATAAPIFEHFMPPLTRRRVELTNCQVPVDGFPEKMNEGKYKIITNIVDGAAKATLETILYVEAL